MKTQLLLASLSLALTAGVGAATATATAKEDRPMSLHELTANTLAGKPQPLAAYKGKVVLVVNVASECGFTPQYAGLEKLFEEYAPKGLVVLGFPSNDFGAQEPGSADQIATFCKKNYGVTFPMFEKIATHGASQSPVYKFLTAKHGEPKWNFHKYLVGKDGQVKQAFASNVAPESKDLRGAIDAALKD
jgi:glutathione peroxidase